MPSITYWNRLEPRSRSADPQEALAARIRDPLWMLARQWQMGEFHGEDAGSPAWITVAATVSEISSVRIGGKPAELLHGPIENQVQDEVYTAGLTIRVELGQVLEDFLAEAQATPATAEFLRVFRLTAVATDDRDAARFAQAVGDRAIDGYEVYVAARASLPRLPAALRISPALESAVRQALASLIDWVSATYGELGAGVPAAWRTDRLEYRAECGAAASKGSTVLSATSGDDASFEWFRFQREADEKAMSGMKATQPVSRSLIPAPVRFPGMPNARWWDFENGNVSFGNLLVDREDTPRLIFMDFLLVHSNDWFVLPFEQPAGSLCRIDALTVHDVFGSTHSIDRAASPEWGMWTLSSARSAADPGLFLLAPSAGSATLAGDPFEDVCFFRDEMANLVWAIEETTEGELGQTRQDRTPPRESSAPAAAGGLRYRLAAPIPPNWIPFLPVTLDPKSGQVVLELAAVVSSDGSGDPVEVNPRSRILRTQGPYRLREEEIPREGLHVTRRAFRCRWWDGTTHTWIGRGKRLGAPSSGFGLRFDACQE